MHIFKLTSPKVSISLRFLMQKKGFSLLSQWIVYFSSLVHPGKLVRNYLANQRFLGWLFKFLIVFQKKGVTRGTLTYSKQFNSISQALKEVILALTSFFQSHLKYINLLTKVLKSTKYFFRYIKAFGKVWQYGLIFKIQENGIFGK